MRFLHLSDTHLGYHQYGLVERAKDYFDAFMSAVDVAIDRKVDFIIHTGDFFHTHRPSNQTLLEGIEIIRRLNDHNIPIFTIAGNHDRGSGVRDTTALEILKHMGLKVLDKGLDDSLGVNIFGLKYISPIFVRRNLKLEETFENLYNQAKNKNNFNILMLHLEFEPFFNSGIKLEHYLPEGMYNYVGIGHYHQRQEPININGSTVVYSGSTEYTQFNEKLYTEKGCYVVEVENGSCRAEFVPIKNRMFLSYSFNDETISDVINSLKELDLSSDKKPILSLEGSTKNFLTNKEVFNLLQNEGLMDKFLHVKCEIKNLSNKVLEFQVIQEDDKSTTIKEKLKELLEEPELLSRIEKVLEEIKAFEDIKDFEAYIESHQELLEL
ncbi:metallophosphoesterase family protein [Sulfurihydrogenibium subterraneum]|uniref:metallophosphoesterase family protein n=1 Tax=Sulfurihydrogenibium subterraneum TaxID=171121 RepID=UPI00049166DB|nr:exonuclease SbcCD subunit D [Sulfurihydrogenibium subterraneum]